VFRVKIVILRATHPSRLYKRERRACVRGLNRHCLAQRQFPAACNAPLLPGSLFIISPAAPCAPLFLTNYNRSFNKQRSSFIMRAVFLFVFAGAAHIKAFLPPPGQFKRELKLHANLSKRFVLNKQPGPFAALFKIGIISGRIHRRQEK